MWFKVIVFAVVIFGIYLLLRNKLSLNEQKKERVQNLLECQECGTYFTKDEGVRFDGKIYCSKECKDKAKD